MSTTNENKPVTADSTKKEKPKMVTILGYTVREGSKQHAILVQQKKHFDDLAKSEQGFERDRVKNKTNNYFSEESDKANRHVAENKLAQTAYDAHIESKRLRDVAELKRVKAAYDAQEKAVYVASSFHNNAILALTKAKEENALDKIGKCQKTVDDAKQSLERSKAILAQKEKDLIAADTRVSF